MQKGLREYTAKIVVVGDSCVGKTSLIKRYCENIFSDTCPINGLGTYNKVINLEYKKSVRLNIWDSAGLEYRSIPTTNYYNDAKGVLVVFDVTNNNAFITLDKWFRSVYQYAPSGVVTYLVGTKIDMTTERIVSQNEGQLYSTLRNIEYREVSSKTSENVAELFARIATDIVNIEDEEIVRMPISVPGIPVFAEEFDSEGDSETS